ncbi:MAG: hypothetical protein IPK14_27170 [Blastocatellia bacterium]|nr:hypothetical protein [Blastocatellia bacterium]MBL8196803.1 hypothetical protein [Blastocatellia bacterium]
MKENPKHSETKALKSSKTTGNLEQVPSAKKRSLNTDLLATSLTDKLDKNAEIVEQAASLSDTTPLSLASQSILSNQTASLASIANVANSEKTPANATIKLASENINKISPTETTAKTSDKVVQEILKEVAKEVAKETEVNPAIEPLKTEVKKADPAPIQQAVNKIEASENNKNNEFLTNKITEQAKASSWAEKPIELAKASDTKKVDLESSTLQTQAIEDLILENSQSANKPIEMPLFNSINQFSDPVPEVKTKAARVKSLILWTLPIFVLFGVFVGIVYSVPNLRNIIGEKLPPYISVKLGLVKKVVPLVSMQEYRYSVNPTENTVTFSGVVTNLSQEPINQVQLEFLLTKRGDVRLTDKKVVTLEPAQLAPKQEAKYEFTVSAKDYQESKFVRMFDINKEELKVKPQKIADLPLTDPSQAPNLAPLPNNKPKAPDNNIYEGSVN